MSKPDSTIDDAVEEHPDESALLDFSAGVLGIAAGDAVIAHLDTCSRCRQLLSILTRSSEVMESQPDDDHPTRVGVDLLVGQMLGEYRVVERINQGGMGVLYRGEQPQIGKPVAIKVLLPEIANDPNLVHRLLGEARAVNSIRHPNIIDIFTLGQLPDGRHYMVMELLEGKSLGELLKQRGRLQAAEVQLVLEQSMGALQAAHAAGVIHRDLKPENIFVNPRSDGWRVTLLDFGLAKQQGSLNLTAPNVILGTPGYMAPEQIRGEDATPAIDIYAMGIVAWQLLAGREPYSGGSMVQVMKRHLDAPIPQLRALVPGVPVALEALVLRMMAKEAAARPGAEEARKILVRLKNDPRRNLLSGELTQLVSPDLPQTVPEGVAPVPPPVVTPMPLTIIESSEPNPTPMPMTVIEGSRPNPAMLTTRPDRPAPKTLPETPVFLDGGLRKAPLIMTAIGLALIGGAVGMLFTGSPPPRPAEDAHPHVMGAPLVVVDPPVVPRAEVERNLAGSRAKANALTFAPTKRTVLAQLERLEERLKQNEPPGAIALELDALLENYELK